MEWPRDWQELIIDINELEFQTATELVDAEKILLDYGPTRVGQNQTVRVIRREQK